MGQGGQALEHAATVAANPQAFVQFVHGQRAGNHDDVVGDVLCACSTQAAARIVGPGLDARRAAMLVHLASVRIKGNGHRIGLEPEAPLARDDAGRIAHVVQVVAAGLELVLHVHGVVPLGCIVERVPHRQWRGKRCETGSFQERATRQVMPQVVRLPLWRLPETDSRNSAGIA